MKRIVLTGKDVKASFSEAANSAVSPGKLGLSGLSIVTSDVTGLPLCQDIKSTCQSSSCILCVD